MTARDLVAMGVSGELYTVEASQPVEEAIRIMSDRDFSQLSVTRNGRVVGSLNEAHLYNEFVRDPSVKQQPIESIMQPAFPFVDVSTPVQLLATMITPWRIRRSSFATSKPRRCSSSRGPTSFAC